MSSIGEAKGEISSAVENSGTAVETAGGLIEAIGQITVQFTGIFGDSGHESAITTIGKLDEAETAVREVIKLIEAAIESANEYRDGLG